MIRAISIAAFVAFSTPALAQSPDAAALKTAYAARASGNWDSAKAQAAGLGVDIIEWHRLRAGVGSFDEYRKFLSENPDWPGLPLLAQKGEASISSSTPPRQVIDYLTAFPPSTATGALKLIDAYEAIGATGDAAAQAVITWRELPLSSEQSNELIARYGATVTEHSTARINRALWDGNYAEAANVATLMPKGWSEVVQAVKAVATDENGMNTLINAIPNELGGTPVLSYERFIWRAKNNSSDDAVTWMLQQSTSRDALGEPERWGDRRRSLARQMMRDGKARIAYSAASRHYLLPDEDHYADLEWLSGYIALRYLDDPARALDHFNRFRMSVSTPISLGRAGYWEGRALEALGAKDDAQAAYAFGAQFQTSFYGLLAAERAGIAMDEQLIGAESFPPYAQASFMSSSVLQAAMLLFEAGDLPLAARFMRHLGESLTPVELGQLGDIALDTDPYLAVLVAKFAADRGVVLNRAYYPLQGLETNALPVPAELALSIARRESEFYPQARSHVGAAGLMQLMPKTGQDMADRVGLESFEPNDLYDPEINVRLGSEYLAKLIEDYGYNIPLISVGYNAGPTRANRWIETYGDPRSSQTNVIDWIEHIPFRETRNYVMRVAESVPVYRARLSGSIQPITLSRDLKAR
ncbi:soluble lytic murein transglycosylase [Pacificibacter maritimus]|uniref:Soluble lytic murein transglycosylase n=1 Tax=Pacificibacter maritimus TaxID=762213 RepID=A0A3N4TX86_9RHOB|nr:lytic transglycosylase domain-containing protein [Pacificibacter maritimus]RPE63163.1 soluble lytic murein transglycosylase [Pacificibacter maritimus]